MTLVCAGFSSRHAGTYSTLRDSELFRYSCLIIGILLALLFITLLITCRLSGFPFAENAAIALESQETEGRSLPGGDLQLNSVRHVVHAFDLAFPARDFPRVDTQEVDAPVRFYLDPALQVVLAGGHEPAHLGSREGFFGHDEAVGMAGAYLNKH